MSVTKMFLRIQGFTAGRALLFLGACLLFGATSAKAITVNYTLNAQLAAHASSGTDPLGLAGKAVSITGSVNSVNGAANLSVSLGSLQVALSNVTVNFAPGTPGSIAISGQAAGGVPFSASIIVNVPSATAAPFPTENIQGGSLSYGSPSTVIAVTSGTVSATSSAPSITASPGSLSFTTQAGVAPPSQTVSLSSTPTVSFTAKGNDSWVTVTPASGQTGSSITVALNAAAMPTTPGLHTSGVTITSSEAANSGFVIAVSVTITSGNNLSPNPSSLNFLFQLGGSNPSPQTVTVGSTGGSLMFTASAAVTSGGNWLSVSPNSGATTAALSVSVNPAGLAVGSYAGTITLKPSSGSSVTIPVALTVAASANLSASPSALTFAAAIGGTAPSAQAVAVTSKGATASLSITVSTNSGGNWLSATPTNGSTPLTLSVNANPAGLGAGTYTGSVTVSPGVGQAPLIIAVTFTVAPTVGLAVTPASLNFTASLGSAGPGAQTLNVGGTGAIAFTISESSTSGGPWFAVSQGGGTSPANLTVTVNLAGLAAGSYAGTITVTPGSGGGSAVTVPVALTVSATPALTAGKSALAFAYEIGATAPAARTVSLTSTVAALSVNAAGFTNAGGAWLTATPSTATTPGNLTVTANPTGLAAGVYTGAVSLAAPGAIDGSSSIAVVLSVSATPGIAAAPNAIAFSAQAGGDSPAPQAMDLASTGAAFNVTALASADSGGKWLSVTPGAGVAPGSLTASANTKGLATGTYTGSISLSYGGASPLVIPVTLAVNPPVPTINAITDAASLASGSLAPMSLMTIWGANLGPKAITPYQLNEAGAFSTTLANTQVMVNGVPAPLLMVSANQINAIVPGSTLSGAPAGVQVIYLGQQSAAFSVKIADAAPGLFTVHQSGSGQGAILNENTSANSSSNPAEAGTIVSIYLDGAGLTNPPQADGSITPTELSEIPKLTLPVSVEIGGGLAQVLYAGPAPGAVAGLTQVNARIPAGTPSGPAPVVVTIGTALSQTGVTVAVK